MVKELDGKYWKMPSARTGDFVPREERTWGEGM
jgi:hypothetical protein